MNTAKLYALMQKRYDFLDYNCFHFARDVYLEIVGIDIESLFSQDLFKIAPAARHSTILLRSPVSPCLVLFSRPALEQTHIGVWLDGNVLHLSENGAKYEPLHDARLGFIKCTFFQMKAQQA